MWLSLAWLAASPANSLHPPCMPCIFSIGTWNHGLALRFESLILWTLIAGCVIDALTDWRQSGSR
jgi:hypothetical protein